MVFPLWSSSIRLYDICLRAFLIVGFSHLVCHLRHGYYVYYLCSSLGCLCSVIISVVPFSALVLCMLLCSSLGCRGSVTSFVMYAPLPVGSSHCLCNCVVNWSVYVDIQSLYTHNPLNNITSLTVWKNLQANETYMTTLIITLHRHPYELHK
jgi:hypothetical protein